MNAIIRKIVTVVEETMLEMGQKVAPPSRRAAAILHPKMGAPVRKVLGRGAALIPSSKKRSGPGTTLDIPLGHKDAAFVRSHFDGMEVQINDAPRANEIMVAVAVTDSGRPLPRVGGLKVSEIKGEDGLR